MKLKDTDKVIEKINRLYEDSGYTSEFDTAIKTVLAIIDDAPSVDFEALGKSLNCQIRASYGSCDDCELSCPRNELIRLLGLKRPKGEWLRTDAYPHKIYCSVCYKTFADSQWEIWKDGSLPRAFCPNCGVEMKIDEVTKNDD